ncbi:putative N-acetyltransferase YjaB [compost metagenome]
MKEFQVKSLDVNEQNPQALGFYEHMGFEVYERSEFDEQGNHFPILHMRLKR